MDEESANINFRKSCIETKSPSVKGCCRDNLRQTSSQGFFQKPVDHCTSLCGGFTLPPWPAMEIALTSYYVASVLSPLILKRHTVISRYLPFLLCLFLSVMLWIGDDVTLGSNNSVPPTVVAFFFFQFYIYDSMADNSYGYPHMGITKETV